MYKAYEEANQKTIDNFELKICEVENAIARWNRVEEDAMTEEVNRTISSLKGSLKKLNNDMVVFMDTIFNEKIFKLVLRTFNQMAVDKMIKEGFIWRIGHRLSHIRIKKKTITARTAKNGEIKPRINWGESNKLKKALIAKGKLPLKAKYDKNNKRIGDNGGEPWLIYITDDYNTWWYWDRYRSTVKNKSVYQFKPAKGPNGIISQLQRYRKLVPEVDSNYLP